MNFMWILEKNCLLVFIASLGTFIMLLNIISSTYWANRNAIVEASSRKWQTEDILQEITACYDRPAVSTIEQRGEYWVLFNYVLASRRHRCFETITYTTQGDYTFLDNLAPLLRRWNGPISVALYAPGYDFRDTIDSIAYLRHCLEESDLIKKYVTFHIFFPEQHTPFYSESKTTNIGIKNLYVDQFDCSKTVPYSKRNHSSLYKTVTNLTYPINVARNIAKTAAPTHFVLASDLELYPSFDLIPKFLSFVENNRKVVEMKTNKVFVLPVFEILSSETIPASKTELQKLYRKKKAFYFHKRLCSLCHAIPNETEWMGLEENEHLSVFATTKRHGRYKKWEPFYIGTHDDPTFDERFSWEGQSNKMSQGYVMCLMDYDYIILDNAFLTHKPGVKTRVIQMVQFRDFIYKTRVMVHKFVKRQLQYLFGKNKNCFI